VEPSRKKKGEWLVMVAYVCNPSYARGIDRRGAVQGQSQVKNVNLKKKK
jgi:hypothetical protein